MDVVYNVIAGSASAREAEARLERVSPDAPANDWTVWTHSETPEETIIETLLNLDLAASSLLNSASGSAGRPLPLEFDVDASRSALEAWAVGFSKAMTALAHGDSRRRSVRRVNSISLEQTTATTGTTALAQGEAPSDLSVSEDDVVQAVAWRVSWSTKRTMFIHWDELSPSLVGRRIRLDGNKVRHTMKKHVFVESSLLPIVQDCNIKMVRSVAGRTVVPEALMNLRSLHERVLEAVSFEGTTFVHTELCVLCQYGGEDLVAKCRICGQCSHAACASRAVAQCSFVCDSDEFDALNRFDSADATSEQFSSSDIVQTARKAGLLCGFCETVLRAH
jgi:hypothetical protein